MSEVRRQLARIERISDKTGRSPNVLDLDPRTFDALRLAIIAGARGLNQDIPTWALNRDAEQLELAGVRFVKLEMPS